MFTYGKPKFYRSPDPDEEDGAEGEENLGENPEGEGNGEEGAEGEGDNSGDDGDDYSFLEDGPSDEHSRIIEIASQYGGGVSNTTQANSGQPVSEDVTALQNEVKTLSQQLAEKDGIINQLKAQQSPLLTNPIVKMAIGLAESGETDVTKLISDLSTRIPDVKTMTPEHRYEFYVRNHIAPKAELSEEKILRMLQKFNFLEDEDRVGDTIASKEFVEQYREKEVAKINEELAKNKKAPVQDENQLTDEQIKRADSELSSYLNKLRESKALNGIEFTDADSKQIDAMARNWFTLWDPKGNPMTEETVEAIHFLLNKRSIFKALTRKGADLARGKKVDGIPRVSRQPGTSTSGQTKAGTPDKFTEYIKSLPSMPK